MRDKMFEIAGGLLLGLCLLAASAGAMFVVGRYVAGQDAVEVRATSSGEDAR